MACAAVPDAMIPRPFHIQRVRKETADTFTLELISGEDGESGGFAPGQFNMLYVFGVGEVPISVSSDPRDRSTLKHTIRAVGTVSKALQQLRKGDTVGVRGPFGSSWPVEEARGRDCVIVAGGIGLAPLRSALYFLLASRESYQKIVLLYGARTPDDILYRPELERWRSQFDLDVQVTVDRAGHDWRGPVGVVPALVRRAGFDPAKTTAMVCGPEVMIRFTVRELESRGVDHRQIYISMERNMKCAIGFCGHCQFGPTFICKDGPVFRYDRVAPIFGKAEV